MPDLINSTSVTWSESGGDLTATATGRVASVQVNDDGTIGSASTASALVIDAAGNVTFNQDVDFDGAVTGISASDVNADPAGTAASAVSTHEGESNPHPQYATGGAQDTHSGLTNNPHSVTAAQVSAVAITASDGAAELPVGGDADRPTPEAGMLRFNSDSNQFEGYDGTAWGAIAGAADSVDAILAAQVFG